MTSVDPVTGPSSELVAALVLHRAHGSEVAKLDAAYLDHGLPIPGSLAGILDELLDAGLLALAELDPEGLRRVTLTTAGRTRYEQLHGTPRPLVLPVPAPQLPSTTPAGRRLSSPAPLPAPGGQPDPSTRAGGSRLHQHGEVLGHGMTRLTMQFDSEDTVVSLRSHLVRVLTTPDGG